MPQDSRPVKGSERRPSPSAVLLGPADANETFSVTIVLRRRPDGPAMPGPEYFLTAQPEERRRMPPDEFAAKYGAAPDDIAKVVQFATAEGLQIVETNAARRHVVVSGECRPDEQGIWGEAGARYRHEVVRRRGSKPHMETYRGRDGLVHVPADLEDIVIGVFGLDNRRVTKHNNGGDPPNTVPLSVPTDHQPLQLPHQLGGRPDYRHFVRSRLPAARHQFDVFGPAANCHRCVG